MKKYNTFEDFLKTLVKPSEETEIPGTFKLEGEEFIYFADDGSGDFKLASRFMEDPCEIDDEFSAKNGSCGEERCKLFTPEGIMFHAMRYKGDLEGWKKEIEFLANKNNITLAWIKGEDFVLSDGKSYKLSECRAEFY